MHLSEHPIHLPRPRSVRRALAPLLLAAATAALGAAPALAAAPRAKIANPGPFTAHLSACHVQGAACGGDIELNGQMVELSSATVSGRVNAAGLVRNARLTATGATDPEVQGPGQIAFRVQSTQAGSGRFVVGETPAGAEDASGLLLELQLPLDIELSGSSSCTIGPLAATFLPALSSFWGSAADGVPYDQANGTTQLMASFSNLSAGASCAAAQEQLGLPGPGSISLALSFSPVLQTNLYRAHPVGM